MIKIILKSLLILLFLVGNANSFLPLLNDSNVSGGGGGDVWRENDAAEVSENTIDENGYGQRLEITSNFTFDYMDIEIGTVSGSPVLACRIGTSADLSSGESEEWTGLSPQNDTTLRLTSIINPSFTTATKFYWACRETGGDGYAKIKRSGDALPDIDDKRMYCTSSPFVLGYAYEEDFIFAIYKQ